jgi:hypothetical protein
MADLDRRFCARAARSTPGCGPSEAERSARIAEALSELLLVADPDRAPPDHPRTASTLGNLVYMRAKLGDDEGSLAAAQRRAAPTTTSSPFP